MEFENLDIALVYGKKENLDLVVIHGDVIDVTKFKIQHPGGKESIDKYIGQDVSLIYDTIKSHTTFTALKELQNFKIGYIKNASSRPVNTVQEKEEAPLYTLDTKKGTVWQVLYMNKEEYIALTEDPHHMVDPPEAILFDTPALEIFTKTPWYVIPLIWFPVVFYFAFQAYTYFNNSIPQIAVCFVFGFFLWTLIEYLLHRFVFHIEYQLPNNGVCLVIHFLLHGVHHAFPMDEHRLVFPPLLAVPIVYSLLNLFSVLFGVFAYAFFAGTLTGYISYDLTHYFLHHITPQSSYYKFLKKYHIMHHYRSPELGFGVSQHFWDKVFGTVILEEDTK